MEPQKSQNSAYYWVGGVVIILLIIGGWMYFSKTSPTEDITPVDTSTTTSSMVYPYGSITLKLGETGHFNGISITPLRVEEDSRCAKDVECIWAGTVKVSVRSDVTSGESTENMITLGESKKIDTFTVGLTGVAPDTVAGTKITDAEYRLTFEVHQGSLTDNELIGK